MVKKSKEKCRNVNVSQIWIIKEYSNFTGWRHLGETGCLVVELGGHGTYCSRTRHQCCLMSTVEVWSTCGTSACTLLASVFKWTGTAIQIKIERKKTKKTNSQHFTTKNRMSMWHKAKYGQASMHPRPTSDRNAWRPAAPPLCGSQHPLVERLASLLGIARHTPNWARKNEEKWGNMPLSKALKAGF